MKKQLFTLLFAAASVASVSAQTLWSLRDDWSNTTNANGAWSYRIDGVLGTAATRGADSFGSPGAPPIWTTGSGFAGWSQANGSESVNGWDLNVGDIYGHTGALEIDWTSPFTGQVQITGGVWMLRAFGRTVNWTLSQGAHALDSGSLFDGDPFSRGAPDLISELMSVTAGDVIRFEAFTTSGFGDYFGLNLVIAAIPEPSSHALLAAAMSGALVYIIRRRIAPASSG